MMTFEQIKNKCIVKIFPFLQPDGDSDYYDSTWIDSVEDGWKRKVFLPMCIEIWWKLFKHGGYDELKKYHITYIKEKWGHFDITSYTEGSDVDVFSIERKYENLSYRYCIHCGKKVKYRNNGWILYMCKRCAKKHYRNISPLSQSELDHIFGKEEN